MAACLLCVAPVLQATELVSDPAGLGEDERARAQAVVQGLAERLPGGLRDALPAQVPVHWTDALPGHVAGRAFAGQLRLQRALLAGEGDAGLRRLQAALVHELVHVADRAPAGRWSRDPRLRELAGWQRRPWKLGRSANHFSDRSPDAYELESAAEYLAVNSEHWLLDDDFACRRPALAAWLDHALGPRPAPTVSCASTVPLLQAGDEEGAVELLQLDPARVHAVDYLFAEGGQVAMSRWGHSMLRLVICREGREPGPACRLDLDQHRVLSFRAFVGDVELSSWRGLTGGYPSRLFVLPLQQVVDEYTKVEQRGLASIPLQLSPRQIAGLLERTAQVHWSYDGRYYFVSNNCAVETAKLLQAGVPALQEPGIERFSPSGLRRRLGRLGMLDESVLDDRAKAIRDGFYFESSDTHYEVLFAAAKAQLALPAKDAAAWIKLDASARAPWLTQGGMRATAGLLLLEQAAFGRAELRARDRLKRQLLKQPDSEGARNLQVLLQQSGQWLRPGAMLEGGGYGLPQGEELGRLQPHLAAFSEHSPQAWKQLRERMRQSLPQAQRDELEQLEANLDVLGKHLRRQAAPMPAAED
nr:DUF4105 domain-containing protein [Stenotrophomonas tumulicola]